MPFRRWGLVAQNSASQLFVGAENGGEELGVSDFEQEKTLGRIEHLGGDPVQFHVPDVLNGVVAAHVHVFQASLVGDLLRGFEPGAGAQYEADTGHVLAPCIYIVDPALMTDMGCPLLELGVDARGP